MMPAVESSPTWRSLLFVPALRERFIQKATGVGADAVILDLEDSIAPIDKERARTALPSAIDTLIPSGSDVVVRVNNDPALLDDDLQAATLPGVAAICIPKVNSAAALQHCDARIRQVEAERGLSPGEIRLLALIESPLALLRLEAIAFATPRLAALAFGSEDFSAECGIEPEPETLLLPCQQIVFAARAAGILPLGLNGSLAAFADLAAYSRMAERSRRIGMQGALCIHPDQVAPLNAAFAPSAEQVAYAQRLLAAAEREQATGNAAFAFEGRMIDKPVLLRAQTTLAAHQRATRRPLPSNIDTSRDL